MDTINRRDLLKGMLAVPLAGALPLAQGQSTRGAAGPPYDLNVVIHGLCAIVIGAKDIDVVVPNVPGHTYGVGSWGVESFLERQRHYSLTGYIPYTGSIAFDAPDLSFPASMFPIQPIEHAGRYCWINLPTPQRITPVASLSRKATDPDLFTGQVGDYLNQAKLLEVPSAVALTYQANGPDVSFGGQKFSVPYPSLTYTNIHIWAEPAFDVPRTHVPEAFSILTDMLNGIDLDISPNGVASPGLTPPNPQLTEVTNPERKALFERCSCLLASKPNAASPKVGPVTKIRNCIQIVIKP